MSDLPFEPPVLLEAIDDGAQPQALVSALHGPRHWRDVARVGIDLARDTPGADISVVLLFAMLHDTQRVHDGMDFEHGPRAAVFTTQLLADRVLDIKDHRAGQLLRAIRDHTNGRPDEDPTVGCCWDADRLTLPRVGIAPDVAYLSTDVAKQDVTIQDAYDLVLGKPDQSWADIVLTAEFYLWKAQNPNV